jgi:colicin import membrane protein
MVKLVDAPRVKPADVKASKGGGSGGGKVVVKEAKPEPKKVEKKKKTETKAASKKQPKKAPEAKKTSQKKGTGLAGEDASKKKSSSPKSVAKTSKGDDAESAYASALNKIKQKVDSKRKQEEVARIRDKIASQGSGNGTGSGFPAGTASAGGLGGIPSGQGTVAQLPLNYRLYYQVIEEKIKRNWNLALPPGLMEDMRAMEVVISITIKADGTITDLSFEKKSGNIYLDDSAFRAVKKSSPLPPFSEYNIRESFFETGIVFPVGELL